MRHYGYFNYLQTALTLDGIGFSWDFPDFGFLLSEVIVFEHFASDFTPASVAR